MDGDDSQTSVQAEHSGQESPSPTDSGDSDNSSGTGGGNNTQGDGSEETRLVDILRHKLQENSSTEAVGTPISFLILGVPNCIVRGDYDAYGSHVLNLGPQHLHGNLLDAVEDQKWRYLQEALSPAGGGGLERFLREIRDLEPSVRKFYSNISYVHSIQFVTSMVLDGCFIIQILLKGTRRQHITSDDPIFQQRWLFHQVQRDMLLLQNQIPFLVLQTLFDLIASSLGIGGLSLAQLALEFFNQRMQVASHNHNPKHLLHLLQSNLFPSIDGQTTRALGTTNLKPFPSATQLSDAGLEFRSSSADCLGITFENGVLSIPHFSIEDDTKSIFLNLIVFEQLDPHCNAHISAYAFFMNCLINSAEDVSVLCSKGIIDNWLGDDQEVAHLFKQLGRHITIYPSDVYLADVIDRIHNYCILQRRSAVFKHKHWHGTRAVSYLIPAILFLVLAILETFFFMFSYFHPLSYLD